MLIGAALAAMGALFCVLLYGSFAASMEIRGWPEVEGEIILSAVDERQIGEHVPEEFAAAITYGYVYAGTPYTGENLDLRGLKWSKDRTLAEQTVEQYPVGSSHQVRVNPDEPEISVLKVPTKAAIYSIWFPALFFVGGLGIIIRAGMRLIA